MMRSHRQLGGLMASVSLFFSLATVGANADTVTPTPDILTQIQTATVVYLGETHTSEADHTAQLAIIKALHAEHGEVAIALEMFQRPFQPVLDRYLAREISETELIAQSEYDRRWGYPWELYAPILRYAQTHQLPLIALNTPSEVTHQVSREGLASLQGTDLQHIPPIADIDTTNTDYQAFIATVFEQHHSSHQSSSESSLPDAVPPSSTSFNFDDFFAAQVLWDETMAANISEFVSANPTIPVVVLAGAGHIVYDFGIPSRVERRLGSELTQYTILLHPSMEQLLEGEGKIADFFWR